MSRACRAFLAVLALFGALSSAPAQARAGTTQPFLISDRGALLPGELEWLTAREGGRYLVKDGALFDQHADTGDDPRLDELRVRALLKTRSAERVAALRERAAKDAGLPGDLGEATLLLDGRATLLSEEDQAFLRAFRARPPPQSGLEGSPTENASGPNEKEKNPVGDGSRAPAALLPSGAVDIPLLKARLLDAVRVTGTRTERLEIDKTFDQLLKTNIGRELALQFVAEGAKAVVGFGDVAGSAVITQDGKKILQASGGNTTPDEIPPKVILNRHYLLTDEDYRRVEMAETLGHELFGHSFEVQRARAAKVGRAAYYHYRGDEAMSGLIGWTLQLELGKELDAFPRAYLANPDQYHQELLTNQPYYSTTLSIAEMKDPVGTVTKRLGEVGKARVTLTRGEAALRSWLPIVAHFKTVHKIPVERFSYIDEDIANYLTYAANHRKTLDRVEAHMKGTLAHWKTPAGKIEVQGIVKDADSPHLAAFEKRMAARADALRAQQLSTPKKAPPVARAPASAPVAASPAAPQPKPLTYDELGAMHDQDWKDNPMHWEKKKSK